MSSFHSPVAHRPGATPAALRLSALSIALLCGFAHAQSAQTLPTVNVTAQGVQAQPAQDWRAMQRSTATSMKEIMADQPAVNFGGGAGVAQWVSIRGLGQDRIDYVVDDASSDAQIFHHQGRFMMDPALTKVVTVEKGTGSASSGIGAVGGRIEATTVDARDLLRQGQSLGFRANAGARSNKGHNAGFSVYGGNDAVDVLFAGNMVRLKDYKDGTGRQIGNSALDTNSYLLKGALNMGPDVRLSLLHKRETEEGLRNLREEFFFDSTTDSPVQRERTITTTTAQLSAKNLGFVSTLDANLTRMVNEQDSAGAAGSRLSNPSHVEITSNVANLRLSSRLAAGHIIKYGLNLRQQEADSSGARTAGRGSQKKDETGVYVEGIWDFAPVTLTTGLRHDRFTMTGNEGDKSSGARFNPSIGLIYEVNDALSLNVSHNRASRNPRFYEVLLASRAVRFAPGLKPEAARNTEIGFDWKGGAFAVKGSYFWQNINNLHNFDTTAGDSRTVVNRGKLENSGYELTGRYRADGLTARLGVSYSTPKLNGATADSVAVALPMGRQWTSGVSYKFAQPDLEIGWRGRFAEGRSGPPDRSGNPTRRAGYGVHDIHMTWQPLRNDTLTVNVAINNVADRKYSSHSQRSSGAALPEAGREFRLGVNYRY